MYHIYISQYKYTVNTSCRRVGCRGPAKANAHKPNTQRRYAKLENLITVRPVHFYFSVSSLKKPLQPLNDSLINKNRAKGEAEHTNNS